MRVQQKYFSPSSAKTLGSSGKGRVLMVLLWGVCVVLQV